MKQKTPAAVALLLGSSLLFHCSGDENEGAGWLGAAPPGASGGTGGATSTDGSPSAGAAGASPSGVGEGGGSSEGNPTPTGLEGNGGAPVTGGEPAAGGAAAGGAAAGGGAGGASVQPVPGVFDGRFILGADISSADEAIDGGSVFVDTDGVQKSLIDVLKNHGFNFIRLRTFVNPAAEFGYASGSGCNAKAEPYDDKDHTIAFAQQVKAAGMGLLVDFHYSDTWADPGKQVIPEAWRNAASIDALAERVSAYTSDVVGALVAAGARPDMVQVGNEITPGLLIHVPSANTDCYGSNSVVRQGANGSQNDWDNLAALLSAGVEAVRSVDPTIRVMLHIENTESVNGVTSWVRNAEQRGVQFDVLGLSAYEAFQGPSSAWRATLGQLATTFPELSFAIAEYNPQRRLLNDIMRELPDGRGLGTFFWEPTQAGEWGAAMFTWQGNRASANAADFAEYDQMKVDFGLSSP
jgi:arabinogalactan endo-1,4-beta-galactosidase